MKSKVIIAGLSLALVCFAVFLVLYGRDDFAGERIKEPDSYMLDIERMNGRDSHALTLSAGDVLKIVFETEGGALSMEITSPSGASVYKGNGRQITDFEISATESGEYTVTVEARHAKGKIHITHVYSTTEDQK